MIDHINKKIYEFSESENTKFRKIIIDVMQEACQSSDCDDDEEKNGIGTLSEKQMHAALKKFLCPDTSLHEVKIQSSPYYTGENEDKKRRFVADIMDKNTIYEIQTGSFAPLQDKIKWILENTSCNIVLIHPMPEKLYVSYFNDDGSIGERRRSPHSQKLKAIIPELYYIKDFIKNDRFTLITLMIEADQYKKRVTVRRRQKSRKYETIPTSLLRANIFSCQDDYKIFIPKDLPDEFTVREFSQKSGILGLDAYSIVKLEVELSHLCECGNKGKAKAYKKCYVE